MAITSHRDSTAEADPLFSSLCSIKKALDESQSRTKSAAETLDSLLEECVATFRDDARYRNDVRFLKIWLLYADSVQDFDTIYKTLEEERICLAYALLYKTYAVFLEAKGKLVEADRVYRTGISRNAEPVEDIKRAHLEFLKRMSNLVNGRQAQKIKDADGTLDSPKVNPWSHDIINDLLKKMAPQMRKYHGYFTSTKNYSGKVPLSSLHNCSRNKIIEIGNKKYQIKGSAGKGGFAQVFRACVNSDPDEVVALKIQKPPFPWEFYMYRQLDERISGPDRSSFSYARWVHLYTDYSILVCDYLAHGTLQDAINSYVVVGQKMPEVLCVYYCIEMFRILETLHSVGIIHGDFKPDNLLVRYPKDDLKVDGYFSRSGSWSDQGLCLTDWGRGIDLKLFPDGVEFNGDCRTSGFRCIEIQEKRLWKFQVDTYCLCAIAHMMIHGSYMATEKVSSYGKPLYQPTKAPLKRYYNAELWSNLFKRLLNPNPGDDHMQMLQSLRKSFEDYLSNDHQHIRKLTDLLRKQRASLCSS